tara:strand:+ start:42279 stop:42881 length:603 start_codon:yes stop_codon:yes gene_type:complete
VTTGLNLAPPSGQLVADTPSTTLSNELVRTEQDADTSALSINPNETRGDGSISCASGSLVCPEIKDGQLADTRSNTEDANSADSDGGDNTNSVANTDSDSTDTNDDNSGSVDNDRTDTNDDSTSDDTNTIASSDDDSTVDNTDTDTGSVDDTDLTATDPTDGSLGGAFTGNQGEAFLGGFELIDSLDQFNTVDGLFTIER